MGMRTITIAPDSTIEFGRRRLSWEKRTGFVNQDRLSASELVRLAGYHQYEELMVEQCHTDDTYFDADFEEDRKNAELVGNPDYGYADSDTTVKGYDYPVPNQGECWIFILGVRYYQN